MGAGDMDNEDGLNGERRLSLSQTNRELLSEEEKRMNHIMSEKKRRNNIREAFKTMTDIIPSLRNTNFSKATILNKGTAVKKKEERKKISNLFLASQPTSILFSSATATTSYSTKSFGYERRCKRRKT